jgi:hypothetical protein
VTSNLGSRLKSIQYFLVTALAVVIGHVSSWSMPGPGPFSAVIVLAVLYGVLRQLRQRDRSAIPAPLPAEVAWTIIAFCALFVGGLAGMMAFNPDGYMQPKPTGAPWWLIIPGSAVGALGGAIIAGFLTLLNRLTAPHRR